MIFILGIIAGLAVSAPIGPVGFLCVRKTMEFGLLGALAIGVGSALADVVYSVIAVFAMEAVSQFILAYITYFKIVGGLILFGLAINEYYSRNVVLKNVPVTRQGFFGITMAAFVLTLVNPMSVITFVGIFAMLSDQLLEIFHIVLFILGIMIGSIAWFLILGKITFRMKSALPERFIGSIRKVSAGVFALFGVWAFLSL